MAPFSSSPNTVLRQVPPLSPLRVDSRDLGFSARGSTSLCAGLACQPCVGHMELRGVIKVERMLHAMYPSWPVAWCRELVKLLINLYNSDFEQRGAYVVRIFARLHSAPSLGRSVDHFHIVRKRLQMLMPLCRGRSLKLSGLQRDLREQHNFGTTAL